MNVKRLIFRLVVDVTIIVALGAFFLYHKLSAVPYQRGFSCNDKSIGFPFRPDTISSGVSAAVGIAVPVLVILVHQVFTARCHKNLETSYSHQELLKNVFFYLYPFTGGCMFGYVFVTIGKFEIGRLRPNFLDVCKPTFEVSDVTYNCANTTELGRYVAVYKCVDSDARESQLSFPSGHTAFTAFCMIYLVGYLHFRVDQILCTFSLKPFLQACCLWYCWWVGLSRICDYMHHWSDVLAGGIIGTLASFFALWYMLRWPKQKDSKAEDLEEQEPIAPQQRHLN